MRASAAIFLLVVGLTSVVVECQRQPGSPSEQQISARCQRNSVTPVSCAQPAPHNLLPHPDDCELFYYCVSEQAAPICRQCPARLHFNPHSRVCDHPDAAGCALASRPAR